METEEPQVTSPFPEANVMELDSSCQFDESSLFMDDEDQELEELNFNDIDSREEIKLLNQTFTVSSQLCQDREELDKIFSMASWNSLPSSEKERLMTFLPNFNCPENHELRLNIVEQLLTGENFKFGNPVEDFKEKMWSGKFTTDSVRMSAILMKSKKSQYRARLREQSFKVLINVLQARKKILESITNVPVRTPLSVLRMKRKSCKTSAAHDERIAKRYFRDLSAIRQEREVTEYLSSEDENFPDGPLKHATSPHEISLLNSDFWQTNVTNGRPTPTFAKPDACNELSSTKQRAPRGKRRVGSKSKTELSQPSTSSPSGLPVKLPTVPLPQINFDLMNCDQSKSPILLSPNSKFESLLPRVPVSQMSPLAHLMSSPPPSVLMPLSSSPNKPYENHSNDDDSSLLKANIQRLPILNVPTPSKPRKQVNDMEVVEEAVANIPGMDLSDVLDDSFNLDFSLEANPVDLGDGPGFDSPDGVKQSVEIPSNNSCSCFFSLLKGFFLDNPDLKMTLTKLESCVGNWEIRGNHKLSWFNSKPSWKKLVRSAVAFLCNFRPDLSPEDFQAYLRCCDPVGKAYQWVEVVRESDAQLQALCEWWLNKEATFRAVFREELENVSSSDEVNVFQMQERERMAAPNKFYTYRIGNLSAVVPPIRGPGGGPIGSSSGSPKKPHRILVPNRPSYVSTAVIVRDAIARLKTGEGTRHQICELVKQSNFINSEVFFDTKLIVSHVSSALDRLQGEADPCCKHDSSRKVWVNLHFGRKEEDYERLKAEQSQQIKPAAWSQPVQLQPTVIETRTVPCIPEVVSYKDDEITSIVNPILPTEPLQRAELQKISQRNIPPPGSSLIQRPVPGQGPLMVQTMQPSTPPKPPVVPKSVLATTTAASYTSPLVAAKNVQMIQIMTSQGLKTFKLASPKPVQLTKPGEARQEPLLKPTVIPQPQLHIPLAPSKPKDELSRPVPEVAQSRLKLLKPQVGTPPASQAQHGVPAGQRIIVRDTSGKEVHLPSDVLARLLAAQKKTKTVEAGKELVNSDNSPVQVIPNPVVSTPVTMSSLSHEGQLKPRPQIVSIQGNVSNFNPQQLQTVQLLSPTGSGVRLLQPAAPRMVNRVTVAPPAGPSVLAIGGRQFILTPNQNGPLQQQHIVRSINQQQVVQSVGQQVVVSSPSVATIPPRHVFVHNVGGNRKSVVLSQEQLQQLTNVRFVQGPKRP